MKMTLDAKKPIIKDQPGVVDVHVDTALGNELPKKKKKIPSRYQEVPVTGPKKPRLMFVGANPSREDAIRGEALTGGVGLTFDSTYLSPLNITKSDVAITHLVPWYLETEDGKSREPDPEEIEACSDVLMKQFDEFQPEVVVALGRVAKQALGHYADVYLPHPGAVGRFGNTGEVERKLKRVFSAKMRKTSGKKKYLDAGWKKTGLSKCADDSALTSAIVKIAKADDANRLVTGVVLDPYQVDAHNDWISPDAIEKTAHAWFEKSRAITLRHVTGTQSRAVESYVVDYPSARDRKLAIEGQPHRAFRRVIGNQKVHSGAWVVTTKLSEPDYVDYQKGELSAYSIEGFGLRRPIAKTDMPTVQFVDIIEVGG